MTRVALGFANRAGLAQTNLGFRIVEAILAGRKGLLLERFYLPERGLPLARGSLRTTPSGAALSAVDALLFSLSFEGDALHVPAMLSAGGLPVRSAERRRGHPLVVAGGAAVMINPEPLTPFFDLFLVGEAEELLVRFLDCWEALRHAPRGELLAALDELPGALVPQMRRHQIWSPREGRLGDGGQVSLARPARSADGGTENPAVPLKDAQAPVETVKWEGVAQTVVAARLPPESHFRESLLLELERGCPRGCRFCVASRIYAPLRVHDPDSLLAYAEHDVRPGERIGLLGLSAGDYRHLDRLTEQLVRCGWRISISSLPPDFHRPRVVADLVRSGTTTITIAPETGTDRLRALAGKNVGNDAILRTARLLGEAGVLNLRTYFLIGLPFEREADVIGIARLLAEIRGVLPSGRRLSATVNPFVPKPRTPFQWAAMASRARLEGSIRVLRREMPPGVQLRIKSSREARLHAALTRGDATWGARIERAALEGRALHQQLRSEGSDLEAWTGSIDPDAPLPWGYLISEREMAELQRQWRGAQEEAGSPGAPA
ncbi:MAG: radical SAM protein [Candidatus Eisenbacteria bacterium]